LIYNVQRVFVCGPLPCLIYSSRRGLLSVELYGHTYMFTVCRQTYAYEPNRDVLFFSVFCMIAVQLIDRKSYMCKFTVVASSETSCSCSQQMGISDSWKGSGRHKRLLPTPRPLCAEQFRTICRKWTNNGTNHNHWPYP